MDKTDNMDAPEVIENLEDLTLTSRQGFVSFKAEIDIFVICIIARVCLPLSISLLFSSF